MMHILIENFTLTAVSTGYTGSQAVCLCDMGSVTATKSFCQLKVLPQDAVFLVIV